MCVAKDTTSCNGTSHAAELLCEMCKGTKHVNVDVRLLRSASLLYQTLHTIFASPASMIRHGVNVKVTPLRVHLYSRSNH